MTLLVIFESFEGQTRKIATFVAEQSRIARHTVRLFNAADEIAAISFDGIDKVILAAPVHERRHPAAFEGLVAANREALTTRPTLFLSVSLKAAFEQGMEEARDYVDEWEMRTGFKPEKAVLVAGAVRSDSYGRLESEIVQSVVVEGCRIALVDGVHEFTDWKDLEAKIRIFLGDSAAAQARC
jgi:menaquinone-dependent protoporphyrinogen oxidase